MLKIVFLDIDGVLNRRPTKEELAGNHPGMDSRQFENAIVGLNPILIKRFQTILDSTGAKIVFSTSWRLYKDHPTVRDDWRKSLADMLNCKEDVFLGDTPDMTSCNGWDSGVYSRKRGQEIKFWIENHIELGKFKYAVIDDVVEDIVKIIPKKNIFKTDENIGLTEEIAKRIISHLND